MTCACAPPGTSVCPCDDHGDCPRTLWNPGGLDAIGYRVGDFGSFRRALTRNVDGEVALASWRPTAQTDLGLQVADWWAYVADVLTFYSERIANEAYLGTATLPESVRRLVGVLGYRPRPGIGARATLAVLANGLRELALPAGLAITSKPAPGIDPQTFELAGSVTFASPTSIDGPLPEYPGTAPGDNGPPAGAPAGTAAVNHPFIEHDGGVLVKGKPTGIAIGDRLLLLERSWFPGHPWVRLVEVTGLVAERDPYGRTNTRVMLTGTGDAGHGSASGFRLMRPTHASHLTALPTGAVIIASPTFSTQILMLDGTARHLRVGDPLLVTLPDPKSPGSFCVVRLIAYEEVIWYANAIPATPNAEVDPTKSPGANGIPMLLAKLVVNAGDFSLPFSFGSKSGQELPPKVTIHSGWVEVGKLIETPVHVATKVPWDVVLARPPAAPFGAATPALLEDARGRGVAVNATPKYGGSTVALSPAAAPGELTLDTPLRLLWDLVEVSRGKTVRDEPLTAPVALLPGPDFKLSRKPVTYLADAASRSGDGYSSTVKLAVGGVGWTEVPRFFGRGPAERVFVTREDDEGSTHVLLGDGVNGARLPAGARVTATYRTGSGTAVPPVGTLTQILNPVANLAAVRNPVGPYGGADPDAPERLRELAPRSVLTFGRAVSGVDYATIAAQAPGVARAAAEWAWDPGQQRSVVRVYVGDDDGAVAAAKATLSEQADPNRPLVVLLAFAYPAAVVVHVVADPAYAAGEVVTAVQSALYYELFVQGVLGLGETLYRSRIEATAAAVPGVLEVREAEFAWTNPFTDSTYYSGPRFTPPPDGWFALYSPPGVVVEAPDNG